MGKETPQQSHPSKLEGSIGYMMGPDIENASFSEVGSEHVRELRAEAEQLGISQEELREKVRKAILHKLDIGITFGMSDYTKRGLFLNNLFILTEALNLSDDAEIKKEVRKWLASYIEIAEKFGIIEE